MTMTRLRISVGETSGRGGGLWNCGIMGLRNCGIMGLWAGERVRASAHADGLVGIVRSAVWMDLDIVETLRLYGMVVI